jgi:hypothetical protein
LCTCVLLTQEYDSPKRLLNQLHVHWFWLPAAVFRRTDVTSHFNEVSANYILYPDILLR